MPESQKPSLSFVQVLAGEYKVLRKETDWTADSEQSALRKMDDQESPLSALCISGGGIRSATFALGVIQAFADKGILTGFDYLSTVSGGGYIGGWLTAWKQRQNGLDKIIPELRSVAPAPPQGTVDPVQHLREYNSYLTPKLGLLSTDTWTLAATIGRNMILNWLVLVPILLFVLMVPRLVLALARLGVTMQLFYDDTVVNYANAILANAIPLISGILFATGIFNAMRYLPGVGRKNHSEFDFLKYCLAPFMGATVTFLAIDSWHYSSDAGHATIGPEFTNLLLWITGWGAAGWIAYLVVGGKAIWRRPKLIAGLSLVILLTGFSTASGAWLLSAKLYQNAKWPVYVTLAAPLLLIAFMLAVTFVVGLTSTILQDEDREWLSRAAAWMLLFTVSWIMLSGLVLLAPCWVIWLGPKARASLAALGATGGWITALGGLSPKTKAQKVWVRLSKARVGKFWT